VSDPAAQPPVPASPLPARPPEPTPAPAPTPATAVDASRKASLSFVANVGSAGLGYAVLLLVGRYLQPEAYGSYLFAVGAVGFLAIVVNLGFGSAHQRHVAQGVPVGQALGVMLRIRALSTTVFVLLVAAAYGSWALWKGPGFTDATTPRVLVAAVALQFLSGARQLLLDTWTGQQRVNRVETLRLADTLLALAVLANACMLLGHLEGRWTPLPAVGEFWAGAMGLDAPLGNEAAALLLIGSYLAAKAATLAVGLMWAAADRVQLAGWDGQLARSYARFALPVAMTGALGLVLQYTDTLMLGFFWTAREVGLYGAAQKLSVLASLLGAAVGGVLFPRFAQLHAAGEHGKETKTFAQAERYLLLLTVPVAAALVALPAQGIHIAVGDRYVDAALPLRLLALATVVMAFEQPMAARFLGRGQTRWLVHSAAVNAGLNVVLNLWFIPAWGLGLGAPGAALATLLSTAASFLYLRWRTAQAFGAPWATWSHARVAAAGAAVGLGWWWAAGTLPATAADRVWELAAWGILGAVAYAGLLALLGEFTAEDRRFLSRAAHPRELLAELRGR
jgi:O-antigen/teichoic acid export membrane protein